MLLHHVRGAKGYEDLRTICDLVTGVVTIYPTFKEAAIQLGLLEDDSEAIACLQESSQICSGRSFRLLFATILIFNESTHPNLLWEQFLTPLTEDLLYLERQVCLVPQIAKFQAFIILLVLILNTFNCVCYLQVITPIDDFFCRGLEILIFH